jgi:hypothetical protein
LLAAFDRRNPLDSKLALLQHLRDASPADLAGMASEMAGPGRSDPAWDQLKRAVLERWVELAPDEAIAWAKSSPKTGERFSQAAEVFGILANVDPGRAMAEAQKVANPALKDQAMQAVVTAMAGTDPASAFELGRTLTRDQQWSVFGNLFGAWADKDPAAATAALLTVKDENVRDQASRTLLSRWAQHDPARALAWARNVSEPSMRISCLRGYFSVVGQRDPEGAIAQISELPRSQQPGFLVNVLGNWMQTDHDAAIAWVTSRPNSLERQQLLKSAVGFAGLLTGEQTSLLVSQLAPGSARDQALKQLIGNWTWTDPEAAIAFTETLPVAERLRLHEDMAQSLASHDPEKAIEYLKEHPIDDPASEAWGELAGSLARKEGPAKALEWANALPDEGSRRKALPMILARMMVENPAEAARQAALVPDEATRSACLSEVAKSWANTGAEEALTWARGLSGRDRETAMAEVLGKGAPYQPVTAASQFDEVLAAIPAGTKPAERLVGAAAGIARAYFFENEQAAIRWATQITDVDARAAAVGGLVEQWVEYDSPAASAWISTLPEGKPRDAAVGQLVGRIASSDPSSAFAWAATANDPDTRSNLLQTSLTSWRSLDAAAARTAIELADWPQEEKAKWLEKVK